MHTHAQTVSHCLTTLQRSSFDPRVTQYPLRSPPPSLQESYLRRAAADGSDLVAERRHGDQQLVVLVEDPAAGGLVQTQQALTAQHVQGETWRGQTRLSFNFYTKQAEILL